MRFFASKIIPKSDIPTSASQPIPKGSRNAIRTTWIAPSTTVQTAQQAMANVMTAFDSYPQEGQNNIDKGGWHIVQQDGSPSLSFRAEFISGNGIWAKLLLRGGKGFVDDVLVEIKEDSSTKGVWCAEVRSSSRVGVSDLGVNQKRLLFLAEKMKQQGWKAPKPVYA